MEERETETILKKFPYVLAFPLKIAFAVDEREEPWKKVDAILYSAEAIARFLGVVSVCELERLRDTGKVEAHEKPGSVVNVAQKLDRPSFGGWIEIARETLKFLRKFENDVVVPEVLSFFDDRKAKNALDELCTMRNTFGHAVDRSKLPKDTFRQIARIAFSFLETILERLVCLENLSFSYVSTIELQKGKRQDPSFAYKGKRLDGMDFVREATVKLEDQQYPHFKETNAVMIRFQELDRYLNLFPFYIYDEIRGKSIDIFYYNGKRNDNRMEYVACGYGGTLEIRNAKQAAVTAATASGGSSDWRSIMQGGNLSTEDSARCGDAEISFTAVSDELAAIVSCYPYGASHE